MVLTTNIIRPTGTIMDRMIKKPKSNCPRRDKPGKMTNDKWNDKCWNRARSFYIIIAPAWGSTFGLKN